MPLHLAAEAACSVARAALPAIASKSWYNNTTIIYTASQEYTAAISNRNSIKCHEQTTTVSLAQIATNKTTLKLTTSECLNTPRINIDAFRHHVPEGSTILKHNPLSAYGYKCSSYTWLLCKSCKDHGVPEEDHDHGAVGEHAAIARALPVLRSTPEPSIIHSIKKAIRKYSLSQKDIASQVEIRYVPLFLRDVIRRQTCNTYTSCVPEN